MGVNTISQENTNNNGFNNFVGTEKWGKVDLCIEYRVAY